MNAPLNGEALGLRAGTRLGPYEIVSPLGVGGMAEVYRARDSRLDRDVAIKVLPDRLLADPESLARFRRETKLLAALSHPNILSIFDVGFESGVTFAVMELLEADTLRRVLSDGPPSIATASDYARQICAGLAAAHEKGIVHRDIKPDNLLITRDGRVKILDFGLARPVHLARARGMDSEVTTLADDTQFRTMPGTIVGTTAYMSPEQARDEPVDHRSDIFSFGIVFYEMLVGRRPFRGTAIETLNAILTQDPPAFSETGRAVPAALERVVRRCLQKAPAERFQSARDIGFALDVAGAAVPGPVAPVTRRFMRRALPILATFTLIAVAWWSLGRPGAAVTSGTSFQMLSYHPQAIFRALFAPDGRIVYSAALQGNEPEIFSLSPQYPEPRALGLTDTHLLSVSSKAELAVLVRARYLMHRSFVGTLARVPLGGGAPREIREGVKEADWAPDGQNLAIIERIEGTDRIEYPIGKVLSQTAGYFSDLRFSPAGDRLAFLDHPILGDDRGSVRTVDLSGHVTVLMPEHYASEQGLVWSPDGSEVFFSAGDSPGFYRIHAVSLNKKVRPVVTSAGGLTIHDISSSGRWLATRDDVRLITLGKRPETNTERDLSFLDYSEARDISSDGRMILFSEASAAIGPNYGLYLRGMDGSPPVRLGDGLAAGLSPDGRWALSLVPSLPPRLMLYPTGPGEARVLPRGPIEAYNAARWFPDNKHVLVCASEHGHALRTYVQDAAGGPPRPLTPDGTCAYIVGPDGRQLLARDPDRRAVIINLDGGAIRPVPGVTADDVMGAWTADGQAVLVWVRSQMPSRLDRIDLRTGARTHVRPLAPADLAGAIGIWDLTIVPDGSAYTYTYCEQRSTLFLVDGAR